MKSKKYDKRRAYHERKPWVKHVCWARRRCTSSDPRWKAHYMDKGIKATITAAEAQRLWERDGGAGMERPSLDRIDPNGPYSFENSRFMEWLSNVRRPFVPDDPIDGFL